MTGWVGEDAPPVAARLEPRPGRAQLQQPGLGLVEVVNREVEVDPLRDALVRPARRPVVTDPLEPDERPRR